ncbi:hypothetical protein Tco_0380620 [Tanacetum coccineum]
MVLEPNAPLLVQNSNVPCWCKNQTHPAGAKPKRTLGGDGVRLVAALVERQPGGGEVVTRRSGDGCGRGGDEVAVLVVFDGGGSGNEGMVVSWCGMAWR